MPGASTSIVMEVPAKAIYEVVLDFENYPKFLPDVKGAKVLKKGTPLVAEFEIQVIRKIHYKLAFQTNPYKKIAWTFEGGDIFKDNKGAWIFEEMKKNRTKVTYDIEVDFGLFVPSLITNKLVGRNLPAMMKHFKDRAEGLR